MNLNDKLLGYIRTGVPYLIGLLLAWLATHTIIHIATTSPFAVAVVAFTVAITTNGYYVVVRVVEVQLPWLGIALGFPKAPEYADVSNLWASIVRTGIPPLVGALIVTVSGWVLALTGHPVDTATQTGWIVTATTIAASLYYTLARAALTRWPGLKWLLGAASPVYPEPAGVALPA